MLRNRLVRLFYYVLFIVIVTSHGVVLADWRPKIFGVTQGSVYKDHVTPRWYEPEAIATLSVNSGDPVPFANGSKISANGDYELIVSAHGHDVRVNFVIDNRAGSALIHTNQGGFGPSLQLGFLGGEYKASPVFAAWAEDVHGRFLQNLYVSAVPATNIMRFTNNHVLRPQAIPFWAHKNCVEKQYDNGDWLYLADPEIPVPEGLDGVTGATQKAAFFVETPVKTNEMNDPWVKIFFEINQSFDSGWYFHGGNHSHEEDGSGKLSDDKYFSGSEEPAIVYSVQVNLNHAHTYLAGGSDGSQEVLPVGYSHYGGRTGTLYTDFFADDNGTQRYKFDHAHKMVGRLTVTTYPGTPILLAGDMDKDGDLDGWDLAKFACSQDRIQYYLQYAAENFGIIQAPTVPRLFWFRPGPESGPGQRQQK